MQRSFPVLCNQLSQAPPMFLPTSCHALRKYKSCYNIGAAGVFMASHVYDPCVIGKWPLYSDENALQNYFPALT